MGMNDGWEPSDIPRDAGTPDYFKHPQYRSIRIAVGEIRGEYIAHGYNNCIVAHRALHLILTDALIGPIGKAVIEAASKEAKP